MNALNTDIIKNAIIRNIQDVHINATLKTKQVRAVVTGESQTYDKITIIYANNKLFTITRESKDWFSVNVMSHDNSIIELNFDSYIEAVEFIES